MNLKYFFSAMLFAALFISSCVGSEGTDDVENYITEGSVLPEFIVSDEDGNNILSKADLMEHSSLIFFFEIGCPYCRNELPLINELWEALKDDPQVKIVPVSRKDESLKDYWADNGLDIAPVYIDKNRAMYGKFANMTIPRTYLVNNQGIVTWMSIGSLPEDMTLARLIEKVKAN